VILDAGGGEGLLQYSLAARCASVVNVDCSEAYIGKVLAGPLYGYFRNIRYEVGDIRKLEYPNDHFDKVFCVSVLEHMTTQTDVMAAAKEMYRVLKPGGHLVLTVDVAPFARWSHSIDDKFLQELFGQWGVIVPPRPEEALIGTCDEAEPRPGEPTQVAMTVFCAKIIKQKSSSNSA
jgi:ubiquinone/menaquinone biosynthesis C-methylase UbiE